MELPCTTCEALISSTLLAGGAVGTDTFAVATRVGAAQPVFAQLVRKTGWSSVCGNLGLCSVAEFDRQAPSESLRTAGGMA